MSVPGYEVQLVGVTKRFGDHSALSEVSFSVARGELLAILGPSGSGKSTLLNLLGGQLAPDEGSVYLGGSDITGLPPNKIDAATVFQDYALFPHMTVIDNVAFGLRMRGMGKADRREGALESLRLVGMDAFRDRSVRSLSGGERQRVATARALAVKPRLLLMDEPLGALDRLIKLEVQREVSELLHRVGVTTVYVTHDQREALTMADSVAILHRGILEQIGSPTDLVRNPATRFVAEFLGGAGNFIAGTVTSMHQGAKVADVSTTIGTVTVRVGACPVYDGRGVTVHVRPEDIEVNSDPDGPAVVSAAVYTGEIGELTLRLDDGSLLTAKTLGIPSLSVGARVRPAPVPEAGLLLEV